MPRLRHLLISTLDWLVCSVLGWLDGPLWVRLDGRIRTSSWWMCPDPATRPRHCRVCGRGPVRAWWMRERWRRGHWRVWCRCCEARYEVYGAPRMTWLKHLLISLMDWFDDVALRHRWRWLCDAVNDSDWWAMPDLATRPVVCDRCGSASIRSWRWSRRWSGGYWGVRCRTCGAEYETRGEVA